jgi:hypothetical protein
MMLTCMTSAVRGRDAESTFFCPFLSFFSNYSKCNNGLPAPYFEKDSSQLVSKSEKKAQKDEKLQQSDKKRKQKLAFLKMF